MTEKNPRTPALTAIFLLIASAFLFSCAARQNTVSDREPLLGQWETNQGILLTVHRPEGNELIAEMTSAPGFYSTDLGAGSIIVRKIQPMSTGMYSGLFPMPGNEQPIKVQLRFVKRNAVVVETGDRRAKGNMMLWRKVIKPKAAKP